MSEAGKPRPSGRGAVTRKTIKSYVEARLEKGEHLAKFWREVQEAFPGRIASWNTLQGIERAFLRRKNLLEAAASDPMRLGAEGGSPSQSH